jgi:hypothetical protein
VVQVHAEMKLATYPMSNLVLCTMMCCPSSTRFFNTGVKDDGDFGAGKRGRVRGRGKGANGDGLGTWNTGDKTETEPDVLVENKWAMYERSAKLTAEQW